MSTVCACRIAAAREAQRAQRLALGEQPSTAGLVSVRVSSCLQVSALELLLSIITHSLAGYCCEMHCLMVASAGVNNPC